ncbi:TAXI family TRAP transporter solute-binding subunit [Hwanghaeella grinnelliae]|uniref:TAXI family TRAP transporter solute-binding subunit n=1 Tax=Hwanghaeella grinnelliae TaxID=2500179 RepID=A0A3S3UPF9_9PROT|nr:TAXI family TRAP transporter solute-binding subunit [Hwanghaeella grinnelliae]RVU36727.1 TAXI family TRAP transporter solute-binding subunit [Hwanghaeella grinnelliae]
MTNKLKSIFVAASVLAGVAMPLQSAHAEYNLTLCGASPGGLWSLLGAGVDAAVKASFPGSTVTYQTSGGGFANVMQIDQKKCDLAIIHDAEVKAARAGQAPFSAPIDSMRSVAVMYTWAPMQLLFNKEFADEHGINTMEDIAAKKVPVNILLNKKGNVASDVGASMLTAAGASPEMIDDWGGSVTYAASKEQGELMRDRRADVILNSLFVNHGSIRELANAIDLKLVPVTKATADTVADEWTIGTFTIPGGSYPWAPDDTMTVTLSAQLFVNADADPAMVKDVTTALIDHADKVSGVHKAMKALDAELMATASAAPYHPAAEEVYKAKGLR